MASAEAPAVAERVTLPAPKCSSSSAGHASLVSFARSQSATVSSAPVFGAPSRLGAATAFPAAPPDSLFDFERAAAKASQNDDSGTSKQGRDAGAEGLTPQSHTGKRKERRSVPKRMREPVSVDALAGLFGGLRPPAAAVEVGADENEAVLVQRLAALDVQKRRRKCLDGEDETEKTRNPSEEGATENVEDGDPDGLANELCFLIDKCDIKPQEKQTGFMPYIA